MASGNSQDRDSTHTAVLALPHLQQCGILKLLCQKGTSLVYLFVHHFSSHSILFILTGTFKLCVGKCYRRKERFFSDFKMSGEIRWMGQPIRFLLHILKVHMIGWRLHISFRYLIPFRNSVYSNLHAFKMGLSDSLIESDYKKILVALYRHQTSSKKFRKTPSNEMLS